MKKTIVALLALAGVAAAAEQVITLTGYGQTDGLYATSVLTTGQLTSLFGTENVSKTFIGVNIGLDDDTTYKGTVGVNTWSGRNEFHVYYNKAAGESVWGANTSGSFTAAGGYTYPTNHAINQALSLENAVSGALTFAFAPKDAATDAYGLSVAVTVAYADGTTASVVGNMTGLSWSNNKYWATEVFYDDSLIPAPVVTKDGNWTHDTLVNANYAALGVPEPATATLSLLALAGLAARRRRK